MSEILKEYTGKEPSEEEVLYNLYDLDNEIRAIDKEETHKFLRGYALGQ